MRKSLVAIIALLVACEASTSPARSPDPASEICPRLAQHDAACGHPFDPNVCAKNVHCSSSTMRPDAMHALYTCLMNEPCVKPAPDACWDWAARPFANDPDVRAFRASCQSKSTSCGMRGLLDDCGLYALFTDSNRAAFKNCLGQPCDWVETCVKTVEYPPVLCK